MARVPCVGALGVGIGRQLFHLQPALTRDQGIDRKLLRIAMHLDPEPVGEERLQHLRHLLPRGAFGQLGADIEPLRSQPVGPDDLVLLQPVRDLQVILQRQVSAMDLRAVDLQANADPSGDRWARRLDRRHFEFRLRGGLAECRRGCQNGGKCQRIGFIS